MNVFLLHFSVHYICLIATIANHFEKVSSVLLERKCLVNGINVIFFFNFRWSVPTLNSDALPKTWEFEHPALFFHRSCS